MSNRRVAAALVVGGLLLTGGSMSSPAEAATPGLPDLAVSVSSNPTTVSPPGKVALYRFRVTNNGTLPAVSVTVTSSTTNGSVVGSTLDPGCSVSANTVTCSTLLLAAGQTYEAKVGVRSQTTPGTMTNTVTASALTPDGDETNNRASVSTPVVFDPAARALVLPGETLSQTSSIVTQSVSVPTVPTVTGVFARLADGPNPPPGYGRGAIADLSEDEDYFARDKANPLTWTVRFAAEDPCNGNGNPACSSLAYQVVATDTPQPIPFCPGYGGEPGGPGSGTMAPTMVVCVNDIVKYGNSFEYSLRVTSTDPIVIPPLSGFGK